MTIERDIKMDRSAQRDNLRTIDIIKSIDPVRAEDVADRDRQLAHANKLQKLIDQFTAALEHEATRATE